MPSAEKCTISRREIPLETFVTILSKLITYRLAEVFILNCDGSFKDGQGNIGFVLVDASGNQISARRISLGQCRNSYATELLAIAHGLKECRQLGIHHVHVKSDCLSAILNIGRESRKKRYRDILAEVSALIKEFSSIKLQHINRKLNKAAHNLAKKGG